MKKLANQVYLKTEEVLFNDKINSQSRLEKLVYSELFYVLKQYFELENNGRIEIKTNKDLSVSIDISFKAKRVIFKTLSI